LNLAVGVLRETDVRSSAPASATIFPTTSQRPLVTEEWRESNKSRLASDVSYSLFMTNVSMVVNTYFCRFIVARRPRHDDCDMEAAN
jgi:hypothetical protein